MDESSTRPAIGKAGLVVVMNREQILAGCAVRGLSLEELRSAAGISRPTLQAALRGKRVRPRTAFRLAQALSRFPVLAEVTRLLDAS